MTLRLSKAAAARLMGASVPAKAAARHGSAREVRGASDTKTTADAPQGRVARLVTIWVPALPPTANHMYVNDGRGGKVLGEAARQFRVLVAAEVAAQGGIVVAPGCDLALTVRLTFSDRRRCDLDNRLKSAQDALALALGFDDSRIARLTAERAGYDKGRPACEMTIEVVQ